MSIQRLIQISDTHCYEVDSGCLSWREFNVFPNRSLQATLEHLKGRIEDHSTLVITGDIAQQETAQTYKRVTEILSDFPLSIYAIPGNHDAPEVMRSYLQGPVQQIAYATLGEWALFFLNTHWHGQDGGQISDSELHQLESRLAEIPSHQHAVIFMHHHPIDIGNEEVDGMCLSNKKNFWDVVEKYSQVKAVFHGHIHHEFHGYYECGVERKIAVYGTPSTCMQGKQDSQRIEIEHVRPGWREIALYPDGRIVTEVQFMENV